MQIGEVADATGVSTKTLRYYEREGLLHEPQRTAAGYRDYDHDVVARVRFIKQAQNAGLKLRQIGEVLAVRDGGRAPCEHVAALVDERLDEVEHRLGELREIRTHLRGLRGRLDDLDPADCGPDEICVAVPGT